MLKTKRKTLYDTSKNIYKLKWLKIENTLYFCKLERQTINHTTPSIYYLLYKIYFYLQRRHLNDSFDKLSFMSDNNHYFFRSIFVFLLSQNADYALLKYQIVRYLHAIINLKMQNNIRTVIQWKRNPTLSQQLKKIQ